MTRNYALLIPALLFSLLIYAGYRTETTVITGLFKSILTADYFYTFRNLLNVFLPLPELVIYALPEGLWVFCITLTSRGLFLRIGRIEIELVYFPLLCSIGLELFQFTGISNGRFDLWDIGFSVLFWIIGAYGMKDLRGKQEVFHPFAIRSGTALFCYLIVYLAHVWQ